jgi:hypothetical protein
MAVRVKRFALAPFLAASLFVVVACNSHAPPAGPEANCASACEAHATNCTREDCWRGCNLVLDRLAEGEGPTVLACVAKSTKGCHERAWAHCAVRVGAHADGGPPAPPPPSDEEDDEDSE